jgi:hypothetical protein
MPRRRLGDGGAGLANARKPKRKLNHSRRGQSLQVDGLALARGTAGAYRIGERADAESPRAANHP